MVVVIRLGGGWTAPVPTGSARRRQLMSADHARGSPPASSDACVAAARLARDEHRARRVVDHPLRRAADQQALEAADPAGADDEHRRLMALAEAREGVARGALQQ